MGLAILCFIFALVCFVAENVIGLSKDETTAKNDPIVWNADKNKWERRN